MKITKKEIKDRIKANGGFNQRRVGAEIVDEIQRCATFYNSDSITARLETLFWILGFSKVGAAKEAEGLITLARKPAPSPVDRAALRKQGKAEAKVRLEQEKLAQWQRQ